MDRGAGADDAEELVIAACRELLREVREGKFFGEQHLVIHTEAGRTVAIDPRLSRKRLVKRAAVG